MIKLNSLIFTVMVMLLLGVLPANAESLRISTSNSFKDMTPHDHTDGYRRFLHGNVVETLFVLNNQGDILPHLATGWEWDFEQTTLTIHLRQGVQFHNGENFTCKDVQRMLEHRSIQAATGNSRFITPLQSFVSRSTCLTSYQVEITLKQPYSLAISDLASYPMGIYHFFEEGFTQRLVGTGPFLLEENDSGFVRLLNFNKYWAKPAALAQVEIVSQKAINIAWDRFLKGDADMLMIDENPEYIKDIMSNEQERVPTSQVRFFYGLSNSQWVIAVNKKTELLKNHDFRCALHHSINFPQLNETVFSGKAWQLRGAQGVFSRRYLDINPDSYARNPDNIQLNMQRVDGKLRRRSLSLLVESTPVAEAIAKQFVAQAEAVDTNIELHIAIPENYRHRYLSSGEYDMVLLKLEDNPLVNFLYFSGRDRFGDKYPDFDRVYEQFLHKPSSNRIKVGLYKATVEYLSRQCAHFFLLQQPIFFVVRGNDWEIASMHMPNGHLPLYHIKKRHSTLNNER